MRDRSTYRAARRNAILREQNTTWGSAGSYFASFRPKQRRETKLSRTPSRYHPLRGIGEYLRSLGKPWGRKQAA